MNDYFTFFYVKHFELPMCMKCAIQINLPCLALPSKTILGNYFFNLWLKPSHTKRDGFEPFVWPFQRCCEEEIVHRTSVIRHHGCLTSGVVDGGSS